MRIAYICGDPGVPVFGRKGCSIHVQEVLRALRAQGAEVELFAVRLGGEAPADLATVPVHRLPVAEAEGGAAREAALKAANDVWRERFLAGGRWDAVYERYSLWSCGILEQARVQGIPALLEVNAPLIEEQSVHRGLEDEVGAQEMARRAFGAASRLLAVSEEVGAYLEGFPEAMGKVEILPNGVDVDRFAPAIAMRRRRSGKAKNLTVGFVGTLKPWHGTHHLVEAFRVLVQERPEMHLLIVGDGPERSRLMEQVREGGVADRVSFTGSVTAEEVPGWLAAMDIAVAPYPQLEQFYFSPLKVYEYMAAGLPVVASRIGQIERLIRDRVNGLLVEPGKPGSLALALATLAAKRSLRERLGAAARTTVERHHTWASVATRILGWAGGTSGSACVQGRGAESRAELRAECTATTTEEWA